MEKVWQQHCHVINCIDILEASCFVIVIKNATVYLSSTGLMKNAFVETSFLVQLMLQIKGGHKQKC